MNQSDSPIHLGTAQGAALGASAVVHDAMHLSGVYDGVCRGYKAEHEAEYLKEWPRLLAMREKRDRILRLVPEVLMGLYRQFLLEIEQFERYMESLTEVKWADQAPNLVTTVGKNHALDNHLAGSGYSVTGPYMFLIGAVSYTSGPAAGDTMASHGGWTEGGGTNAPTYSGTRKTVSWNAASAGSKAPSTAPVFTFTGSGTAKGVGLVLGSGASATIDNTGGTLYSAGLFSGGDRAVINGDTLNVSYTASA